MNEVLSHQRELPVCSPSVVNEALLAGVKVPALLQTAKLCAHLGVNSSTIWRWIRTRNFPAPIEVGSKTRMWKSVEVDAWLNQQAGGQ